MNRSHRSTQTALATALLAIFSSTLTASPTSTAGASAPNQTPGVLHLDMAGGAADVAVVGRHAFVAGQTGLSVVDLDTHAVVASLKTDKPATAVDVERISMGEGGPPWAAGRIFVSAGDLLVVHPSTLTVTHRIKIPADASVLRYRGGEVDMLAGMAFVAVDLAKEQVTGSVPIMGELGGLAIRGDRALVAHSYPGGITVIDLSTHQKVKTIPTTWLQGIALRGNLAFCTTSFGGTVQIIDVDTGKVLAKTTDNDPQQAIAFSAAGVLTHSTSHGGQLQLRDSSTLAVVRTIPVDGWISRIVVTGNTALLADPERGLAIVDLASPPASH